MTKEKEKLEKNFKSPSTGQLCTLPQYIAEIICTRKSEKENKGNLAFKFWNKSQKKQYEIQIICANKLIKKYGNEAVLSFINNNKHIYSLGYYQPHAFVEELIQAEVEKIANKIVEHNITIIDQPTDIKPVKKLAKKNIFSQMKRIENGESEKN
jgi:hypothetical protein